MLKFLLKTNIAANITLKRLIKLSGKKIIFPFYHTVSNKPLVHLRHLYAIKSEKEFIKDLEYLLKYYTPIEPNKLNQVDKLNSGQKNYMLLSFDDGLSEIYNVVLPILKRYSVPAIIFINTAFLDNKHLFYRSMASILVDHLKNNEISDTKFNMIKSILMRNGYLQKNIIDAILHIEYFDKDILDIIAEIVEVNFNTYLEDKKPYLTSEQVKEILNEGYFVGSHSIDHPPFYKLSFYDQVIQTSESLRILKNKFELKELFFSFPFTDFEVSKKLFERIQNDQENAVKYSFGTAGLKNDDISNHFQRIPMEVGDYPAEKIIKSEYLYYLFKAPFGKNTIKRK